jgi:hypothetical protein
MRAPAQTFKAALEAFRDSRRGPPKEVLEAWNKIDWYKRSTTPAAERAPLPPELVGNRSSADMQLLERLLDDPRVEEVWQTIHSHAPDLLAADLIEQIIFARRSAAASVYRVHGVIAKKQDRKKQDRKRGGGRKAQGFNAAWDAHVRELRKYLRRVLKGAPSKINPFYVWQRLDWAAEDILSLWHSYNLGASNQVTFNLNRQGSNEDRARNAFVELAIEFFRKHTGRETLEKEVLTGITVLTEIAIPGKEPDPETIARSERRKRTKA